MPFYKGEEKRFQKQPAEPACHPLIRLSLLWLSRACPLLTAHVQYGLAAGWLPVVSFQDPDGEGSPYVGCCQDGTWAHFSQPQ